MKMQGLLNEVVWDSSISARLLIVVDDAFLRTTLRQQLKGEGFNEVFEASTLLEVFEKLPDANPDLILSMSAFQMEMVWKSAKSCASVALPSLSSCLPARMRKITSLPALRRARMIISSSQCGWANCSPVRSQLWQHKASDTAVLNFGLSFVPANKLLKSPDDTKKVILTEKEATILKYLYRAHPAGVTKEELLTEVWGF